MIPLFKKLKKEDLLKEDGDLLDLGGGDGSVSKTFLEYGYNVTLLDRANEVLEKARENFSSLGQASENKWTVINKDLESFQYEKTYDGIIISNVLPFIKDKEIINNIIRNSFNNLNPRGFLFFSLFGERDQWAEENSSEMSFYKKDEALRIINPEPYFVSEDYGQGITRKGNIKIWHVFNFLYIKK